MAEQDKSTNSLAACRAFISYSHDSPEHQKRVLALANQLRKDGIEAWIDQYVQDPNEGWIRWMRSQVSQASRVLLVFTENYQRRFEGDEEEGKGLGATFEGVIVTQALYERGGRNEKFRPLVFREEDERFIPLELRQFNRYRVNTRENYEALLRWLHGAPRIMAPTLGQRPDLPLEPTPELFASKPDESQDPTISPLELSHSVESKRSLITSIEFTLERPFAELLEVQPIVASSGLLNTSLEAAEIGVAEMIAKRILSAGIGNNLTNDDALVLAEAALNRCKFLITGRPSLHTANREKLGFLLSQLGLTAVILISPQQLGSLA